MIITMQNYQNIVRSKSAEWQRQFFALDFEGKGKVWLVILADALPRLTRLVLAMWGANDGCC